MECSDAFNSLIYLDIFLHKIIIITSGTDDNGKIILAIMRLQSAILDSGHCSMSLTLENRVEKQKLPTWINSHYSLF